MNILFVGKARLEFGGPSLVMSNLKKKLISINLIMLKFWI